jgi:serine protease AprX
VGADVSGSYRDDPMAAAVEEAWQRGIAVVVAAGNSGPGGGGLDSPAHDPYVIAAGASDDVRTANPVDDVMAEFSSAGDGTRNPDVVAPGVGIVSLRVPGASLDVQFPQARIGDANFRGSGTSQAAAVASGAVAQLASARPDLDPDSLKAVLRAAARPLPGVDPLLQGTGVIDVAEAKTLAVPADGRQRWARARRGGAWRIRNAAALQLAVENPAAWPANKWMANTMRGDRWLANTMRGDRWLANTMRSDTWLANTMRSDRWSSNTWNGATFTANQWTSAGWDATR